MAPEPRAQRVLLGPAAGEHEVQPRVARAGGEEGVGQQVDALLLGQPAGVEDAHAAVGRRACAASGEKRADVDAAVPAPDRRSARCRAASRASDARDGESTTSQPP